MSTRKSSRELRRHELRNLVQSEDGLKQVQNIVLQYSEPGERAPFERMWTDMILKHEYGKLREHRRAIQEIADDGLLPPECLDENFRSVDGGLESRLAAIEEVLCSLPDERYSRLKLMSDSLRWFIPKRNTWGSVTPVSDGRLVYLSPFLETAWDQDCVVGIVIHELAHFILEHRPVDDIHVDMNNEADVERLVCEWGFEVETNALKDLPS